MRIRLATPEDGPRLAEIYRPAVEGSPNSVELVPPDGEEMARRVSSTLVRYPWLVAEVESVLGYAYAGPHRTRPGYAWSVEVSIYAAVEAHRRGVGRALYSTLFALLAVQGFQNAYAGVTGSNRPSHAFHLAMGFEVIGTYPRVSYKDGTWLDVVWYGRALGQHPPAPAAPRPLPELVGTPEYHQALAGVSLDPAGR